jgi:hypothetical protein
MILPEGHFKEVAEKQKRKRTGLDRTVAWVGGVVTVLVVAITIFSLTSHQAKNGHGCLAFNYTMVMGGEQYHSCGAAARHVCAKPPRLGGLAHDFEVELRQACAGAGFPYKTAA